MFTSRLWSLSVGHGVQSSAALQSTFCLWYKPRDRQCGWSEEVAFFWWWYSHPWAWRGAVSVQGSSSKCSPTMDVIRWWRNQLSLPAWRRTTILLLHLIPSSVAVERYFSVMKAYVSDEAMPHAGWPATVGWCYNTTGQSWATPCKDQVAVSDPDLVTL